MENHNTFFGYEKLDAEEKQGRVREVFEHVASRYDLMNDLMSGGLHHLWKARVVDMISFSPNTKLLDVAGGTGDIAFQYLRKRGEGANITIVDINQVMLRHGHNRAINSGILKGIEWVLGNAENLPFYEKSFDYYTIGFGIRNVTYIEKALKEAYRVLKTGGRFICLEFSHVDNKWFKNIYDAYSFNIIPKLGELITHDKAPYQYLVESIRMFPKAEEFKIMIENAGFKRVKIEKLLGGVAAIHSGWKI